MIGFAEIPKGARGQCTNTFTFTGSPQRVDYGLTLPGHYSGDFDLKTRTGIESWSPCGGSTAILNMNTACNISPTNLPALIAVSTFFTEICYLIAGDFFCLCSSRKATNDW